MDLQNMKALLNFAGDGQAVPAFNFIDLDDLKGIVRAAELEQTPVILQVSQNTAKQLGLDYAASLAKTAARRLSVPLCLHLDHATSIDLISEAIDRGFTSVMYDGSALPFGENLHLTSRVVAMAHAAGVSVEAELGKVGGKEEGADAGAGAPTDAAACDHLLTDPLQAREFVQKTGVDALAPAVGTVHGLYKGAPDIAFDLICAIREAVDVPLVLHGGSDIPNTLLRQAIEAGIRKVNVGTDLQMAHAKALRQALLCADAAPNMRAVHGAAIDAVCDVARAKIRMCSGGGTLL